MLKTKHNQPYHITSDGGLSLDFHPGQWRAWDAKERFIIVLAGTQGGKTSFGPHWLYREIATRGPGDYLVVTPTYKLLNLKALPEFKNLFENIFQLGTYKAAGSLFMFDENGEYRTFGAIQEVPTRVIFGHAQDPESLESATAKAAWLDEAGQNKFKLPSYEAIMRRLSLEQGRVLITTTPYNLGWIKQKFWDKRNELTDTAVIRFDSTENPSFPQEEMERARRDLALWKFNMFYRAIFTRPAGMIYDCFEESVHKRPYFSPALDWKRYLGGDFGGVNTAAVYVAEEPPLIDLRTGKPTQKHGRLFVYREYHAGNKTAAEHTKDMLRGEPVTPTAYGGSSSEQQWRDEFTSAGFYIMQPPVSSVEIGIGEVYSLIKNKKLFIMDSCPGLLDELMSYSRVLDEMDNPTEKIEDKNTYHKLDALRYVITGITSGSEKPSATKYA